jgi:aminodeoxyfutalosine deaminase
MIFFSADEVFPISTPAIANGIVVITNEGIVDAVLEPNTELARQIEPTQIKKEIGIICPGFVNTHCHLELSYLKNQISEKAGMADFISQVVNKRNTFTQEQIQASIQQADEDMWQQGIVAVGDIANNDNSFASKQQSKIKYHTFIELFDLHPSKANETMERALKLLPQAGRASLVPHAPYTVSPKLFEMLATHAKQNDLPICIHNQESQAENDFFKTNTGAIFEAFTKMNMDMSVFPKTGKTSLQRIFAQLPTTNNLQLVHNTYTTTEDFAFIKTETTNPKQHLYFCTCPNANLYIENKLPDYNLWITHKATITIGTDSLASNWSLSVLDELKVIAQRFPNISLHTMLTWATKNGAEFLGFADLGTLQKGKKPGLNLLQNTKTSNITQQTCIKKLC